MKPLPRRWATDRQFIRPKRILIVLVTVMFGTASWAFALGFDSWRRDTMQAADNAGLYLFLSSPVLAAVSAWVVTAATSSLGELADGALERDMVWRAAWPPFAVTASTIHMVVVLTMVVVARLSESVGSVAMLPIVVQFLSITFFAALGALLGDRFRSKLTAPVTLLALLTANTVLANLGFRKITEVGTGSGDFIDLELRLSYLLPKVAIFGAFTLFALPIRRAPFALDPVRRFLAPAVTVVLAVVVMTADQVPETYVAGPRACHQDVGVTVCGPVQLTGHTRLYDAAVLQVRHAERDRYRHGAATHRLRLPRRDHPAERIGEHHRHRRGPLLPPAGSEGGGGRLRLRDVL